MASDDLRYWYVTSLTYESSHAASMIQVWYNIGWLEGNMHNIGRALKTIGRGVAESDFFQGESNILRIARNQIQYYHYYVLK
jgi:hypothetical protein